MYDILGGDAAKWISMFAYSCFGAALLWTRSSALNKRFNSFYDVIEHMVASERAKALLSFCTFVGVGGLVSMFFVAPVTVQHALAGGMAWSRLAARD